MKAQRIKLFENLAQEAHDFGEGKLLRNQDTRRAMAERVVGLR